MPLDRANADAELGRDLLVAVAIGDEAQNFELSVSQTMSIGRRIRGDCTGIVETSQRKVASLGQRKSITGCPGMLPAVRAELCLDRRDMTIVVPLGRRRN